MTGDFSRMLSCGLGADTELVVIAMTSLMLLMTATYLLIKGGGVWHTVAGVTVGMVAALYLPAAFDMICVGMILDGRLWAQALRWVGLG